MNRSFVVGLARAFGGALVFTLPILMTMEMWSLGSYMEPWRLITFVLVMIPLLVGLAHFAGFEETFSIQHAAVDAFVAIAVGAVTSGLILLLLGILDQNVSAREAMGQITLQAIPGSIGALLAQSQLDKDADAKSEPEPGYGEELFLMTVGALFLAFNLAPTEEMILIAYKMTSWHAIALLFVSLIVMHAFVYSLDFEGETSLPEGIPWWSAFLRFTVAGYAVALLTSVYMLWTFGRLDGLSLELMVVATVVLSFPAAVGAAAARLIL